MLPEGHIVKPGDQLLEEYGSVSYPNRKIVRVKAVTATGRITLENGITNSASVVKFDAYGRAMGQPTGRANMGSMHELSIVTDEVRASMRKAYLVSFFKSFKWEALTVDQLEALGLYMQQQGLIKGE